MTRPILCITGTTGTGKNALGARTAARLGGEVISLDSMKVYRGMDIGTAKPTASERAMAPHHLLDILDPKEGMNLRRFIDCTNDVIADLESRGKPAIVVGGTAMYLVGLLYGVYEGPSRDDRFRAELAAERDRVGLRILHDRLAGIDPVAAKKIDPADYKRIERALEIHHVAKVLPSSLRTDWFSVPILPSRIWVLTWPRDVLRRRIEARVDEMIASGWIDEVKKIREGGGFGRESGMALGYPEIQAFLDGKMSMPDMVERIKIKTWQFSRRQQTWLKKIESAQWIVLSPDDSLDRLAEKIADDYRVIAGSA